jgi:chemotaxis protein MotB
MSSRSSRGGARGGRRRSRGGGHEDEGDHGSHERWLVTYADMLTLLLVLFIVLYSMSVVDTTKFVQLRAGLAAVFDPGSNAVLSQTGSITSTNDGGSDAQQSVTPDLDPSNAQSKSILDQQSAVTLQNAEKQIQRSTAEKQAADVQAEVDNFKKIEQAIKSSLAAKGLTGSAEFSINQRGLVVTIVTDALVFGGNSAVLLPGGQHILDAVVSPLVKLSNNVEVDGHTNQQQTSTAPYPSGWELSSARASSVIRYMVSAFNFPQGRLMAVGFSDQKPLVPPSDPRSITRNRRVDVVVLSNLPASELSLLPSIGNQPTPTP